MIRIFQQLCIGNLYVITSELVDGYGISYGLTDFTQLASANTVVVSSGKYSFDIIQYIMHRFDWK